jgi:predicted branched-subunit amino acid permease
LGTLLGAVLGSAIDPHTYGLDVGFSAAYVAMLFPQLKTVNGRIAAALGAVISVALAPFVPIGLPILAAGLAIFIGIRPTTSQVASA